MKYEFRPETEKIRSRWNVGVKKRNRSCKDDQRALKNPLEVHSANVTPSWGPPEGRSGLGRG